MNSYLKIFIVTICSVSILIQGSEVRINAPCKIPATKQTGSCRRPENCRSFQESSKTSQSNCFTDKLGPVICCVDPPMRISEKQCFDFHLKSSVSHRNGEGIQNGTVINTYAGTSPYGGTPADIGEFRQMAAIGVIADGSDQIDFICGGTLIDPRFVITAAHCMRTPPNIVRLGGVNISNKTLHPEDIFITGIYIHPDYTPSRVYNDIAVLKLNSLAREPDSVPACLWTNENVNLTTLVATGYGQTSLAGPSTDDLIKVSLKYFDNSVCNDIFDDEEPRYADGIVGSQLCAGVEQGKQDTCPGDSGGPIGVKIVQTNAERTEDILYLIGITSFGSGCGGVDAAVYTRITSFLDWIESIIWYRI